MMICSERGSASKCHFLFKFFPGTNWTTLVKYAFYIQAQIYPFPFLLLLSDLSVWNLWVWCWVLLVLINQRGALLKSVSWRYFCFYWCSRRMIRGAIAYSYFERYPCTVSGFNLDMIWEVLGSTAGFVSLGMYIDLPELVSRWEDEGMLWGM